MIRSLFPQAPLPLAAPQKALRGEELELYAVEQAPCRVKASRLALR
jgi:hypothetical protein